MFEVKLSTGTTISNVAAVREVIHIETGIPELSIYVENTSNDSLRSLYTSIKEAGALDSITIIDVSGVADDVILANYTNIISIERVFEELDALSGNLKITIRLTTPTV